MSDFLRLFMMSLHKKWSFPPRVSSVNDQIRKYDQTADLVTFNEEILKGKFHFFCSVSFKYDIILWIYSSTDTALFLLPLLLYSI